MFDFEHNYPWPSFHLVSVWPLVSPLSLFVTIHVVFELNACLWVFSSLFEWILILCFLEPSTMIYGLNFYLALESREYSHFDVGWIQVGESNVCLLVCWLLWGLEKERKKRKRKKRKRKKKKWKKLWKRKKIVWNNVVLISIVNGLKFWIMKEVWLKLFCLKLCELITPLALGKFLFRLALGIIPCLFTRPRYNLEKPLWFLLLYVQYDFWMNA